MPSMSPWMGTTTPATCCSGSPHSSTASAGGSASARGTLISTSRPSICDSAVAAVPDAMLASSRSASSCISDKDGFTGVFSWDCCSVMPPPVHFR